MDAPTLSASPHRWIQAKTPPGGHGHLGPILLALSAMAVVMGIARPAAAALQYLH